MAGKRRLGPGTRCRCDVMAGTLRAVSLPGSASGTQDPPRKRPGRSSGVVSWLTRQLEVHRHHDGSEISRQPASRELRSPPARRRADCRCGVKIGVLPLSRVTTDDVELGGARLSWRSSGRPTGTRRCSANRTSSTSSVRRSAVWDSAAAPTAASTPSLHGWNSRRPRAGWSPGCRAGAGRAAR